MLAATAVARKNSAHQHPVVLALRHAFQHVHRPWLGTVATAASRSVRIDQYLASV